MRLVRRYSVGEIIGSIALAIALLVVPGVLRPARGNTPIALEDMPTNVRLSVMSYNVEGLPFPVRIGRTDALEQIGTRLRELRAAGRQPHIVVLQEAFSDAAKQIGAQAGYRYVVRGPSSDTRADAASTPAEIAFEAASSRLRGEGVGKMLDSGLLILSDYPVVGVRRAAFPTYACAGYDCLANKGVVLATVAVPGMGNVIVADTHLNSRAASGVDKRRSLTAYQFQVDALGRFLRANVPTNAPLILAGDFNMGKDAGRRTILSGEVRNWRRATSDPASWDALHLCAAEVAGCGETLSTDARYSLRKSKDLQIASASLLAIAAPRSISVPFGHESDGTMLSDHVGYVVNYDRTRPAIPSS